MYTIIYEVSNISEKWNTKEDVRKMLQEMCSNSADCVYNYSASINGILKGVTGSKAYYYHEPINRESAIIDVFNLICETIGKQKRHTSDEGIITIDKGFEPGQKVEIYVGDFKEGATPNERYTWSEFIGLSKYVTYDSAKKQIKFNLAQYMKDKKISPEKTICIRFV